MTTDSEFIAKWIKSVQLRDAPQSLINDYSARLASGMPLEIARQMIVDDSYTANFNDPVLRLYQAAFNRLPDADGFNFWSDTIAANPLALNSLVEQFSNSQEFLARYGVNGSARVNENIVTTYYHNILQRAPDAQGLQHWVNSGITALDLLKYFTDSTEYLRMTSSAVKNYHNDQIIYGAVYPLGNLFDYSVQHKWLFDNGEAMRTGNFKPASQNNAIFLLKNGVVTDADFVGMSNVGLINLSDDGMNRITLGTNADNARIFAVGGGDYADVIDGSQSVYSHSFSPGGGADIVIGKNGPNDTFLVEPSGGTGVVASWNRTNPSSISCANLDKFTVSPGDYIQIGNSPYQWSGFLWRAGAINGTVGDGSIGVSGKQAVYTGNFANGVFTTASGDNYNSLLLVWDEDGVGPNTVYDAVVLIGGHSLVLQNSDHFFLVAS